ncbi:MAG TPA: hypothetical protein VKU44_04100, partial [Terriglobia bacterium]|nr:hypothetical protein [Terriglobia bacterium]
MRPSLHPFPARAARAVAHAVWLAVLAPAALHAQAKVAGQILNGTTRRPVAGQEVRLLSPREQMQAVATASTDASGRFVFDQAQLDPAGFYLAETTYQGARYHEPVRFESGAAGISFTVYDSTSSPVDLRVQLLRLLVRVAEGKAQVREQYEVENSSHPPVSYANPKGTFRFRLPPGAGQPTVTVTGLLNMPLPQPAEAGKSAGEFSIGYAL